MSLKIYADTSKIDEILDLYTNYKDIKGFTTNPTLMRNAGVKEYIPFVKELTSQITDKPFLFEIFADEPVEMEYQIEKLADMAPNIYVKVPIMNTKGVPTYELITKMHDKGIKLNVTAIFTYYQAATVMKRFNSQTPIILSMFAGRIADTGVSAKSIISNVNWYKVHSNYKFCEVLWASVREIYNIYEAESTRTDIITVTPDILKKYYKLKDKDLVEFSRETVEMFFNDASASKFEL